MLIFAHPVHGNPRIVRELHPVQTPHADVYGTFTPQIHGQRPSIMAAVHPAHSLGIPPVNTWVPSAPEPTWTVYPPVLRAADLYSTHSYGAEHRMQVLAGGVLYELVRDREEARVALHRLPHEHHWFHQPDGYGTNDVPHEVEEHYRRHPNPYTDASFIFLRITPDAFLPPPPTKELTPATLAILCTLLEAALGNTREDTMSELMSHLDAVQQQQNLPKT